MAPDAWTPPSCPAPGEPIDWAAIERALPFVAELSSCPQDAVFHAEGDVWTHTKMVCEALVGLDAWRALTPERRGILFAAALLHDVGKPACTEREAGRITSKGHAQRGTRLARALLYRGADAIPPPPFATREAICGLVRFHGLPLSLIDKDAPLRALARASLACPLSELAVLAEADALGRRCAGRDQLVERVSLFRDFAREHACLDGPYPFPSDHARVVCYEREAGRPDYAAQDDTRTAATLVCGLPAAGKDHWCSAHLTGVPVISLDAARRALDVDPADDQGRVVATAKERARELLRSRTPFAWNATNTTRTLRGQIVGLCRAYHARVTILYVEAPYRQLLPRNRRRPDPVPAAVIERLIDRLDVPDLSEAHQVACVETGDAPQRR